MPVTSFSLPNQNCKGGAAQKAKCPVKFYIMFIAVLVHIDKMLCKALAMGYGSQLRFNRKVTQLIRKGL